MAYGRKIQEHVNNPKNLGVLDKKAQDVGTGFVGNPECGDMLKLQIKVADGVIQDVKSKTFGCGCAIAATSLATEKLIGRTLDQAKELTNKELAEELDLPRIKIHCSVLAKQAVSKAIDDYISKNKVNADGTYEVVMNNDADSILSVQKAYSSNPASSCCQEKEVEKKSSCCQEESVVKSSCCKEEGAVNTIVPKQDFSMVYKPKITTAAFNRMHEILVEYKALAVKLFSESGGCAGNSYNIDIVKSDEELADGKMFNYSEDGKEINVYIPQASLMFFMDLNVDYHLDSTAAEFRFSSPTLKSCGCGSSFR